MDLKSTFEQIKQRIINNQADIILVIGVILISLLSFAAGYIVARQQEKEPIKFEMINDQFLISNFSGNPRPIGRLGFPKNEDSKGVPPLVAGRGSESPAREIYFNDRNLL